MKKLLSLSLFFLCSFCTVDYSAPIYATTWAGTASNEGVTNAAMYDACINNLTFLFYNTQTFDNTGGNRLKLLSKDSLLGKATWTNINTSFPSLSNKTGKQLIIKSDITLRLDITTTTSVPMGCVFGGSQIIYTNATCTGTAYTNAAMTTAFVGDGNYYTSLEGLVIRINSAGVISYAGYPC